MPNCWATLYHRHASETPLKYRFACGPMMACLWPLDPPFPHQLKKVVKVGPPPTKLPGSVHVLEYKLI